MKGLAFCGALAAVVVWVAGCPDDAPAVAVFDVAADAPESTGGVSDVALDEGPGAPDEDAPAAVDEGPRVWPEYVGEDCGEHSDCGPDGWCVVGGADGGKQCTVSCVENCPDGYDCVAIRNSSTDGLLVCLPGLDLLSLVCLECETHDDCIHPEAFCVGVGQSDGEPDMRCAALWVTECPDGYNTFMFEVNGGDAIALCAPSSGSCICTGEDENGQDIDGSTQACSVHNEVGTCLGTQTCDGANGWTGCGAQTPTAETCDGQDNDCDGLIDNGLDPGPCDVSNEWGTCEGSQTCSGGDWLCDAATPLAEVCDGKDNDCDGVVDGIPPDLDGDGLCDAIDGDVDGDGVPNDTDCEPENADVYPGANEVCNGVDDNCQDGKDEGFADTDGDGLADCVDPDQDNDGVLNDEDNCALVANVDQTNLDGDALGNACDNDKDGDGSTCVSAIECADCNDLDEASHPGADELCDNADNNCNGAIDEGFADFDNDKLADCVDDDDDNDNDVDGLDCAPKNAAIHSGADELCNGVDDNCNKAIDESFLDSDKDGLADCVDLDIDGDDVANAVDNCPAVANSDQLDTDFDDQGDACDPDDDNDKSPDELDCAPLDADVHPNAVEVCNGADENCDGVADDGFPDTDNDGVADCVDPDIDGDLVPNDEDNCPEHENADQLDTDKDNVGDVCDSGGCFVGDGSDCNDDNVCTDDSCDDQNACAYADNSLVCAPSATCSAGACGCDAGFDSCDGPALGGCEQALGDDTHCTACNDTCGDEMICKAEGCAFQAPKGVWLESYGQCDGENIWACSNCNYTFESCKAQCESVGATCYGMHFSGPSDCYCNDGKIAKPYKWSWVWVYEP